MKPRKTFIDAIQAPDFGSFVSACGKRASRKNGNANARLKASIPIAGYIQSPDAAEISNVPTSGTVQVNVVSVNVKPIRIGPIKPAAFDFDAALLVRDDGIRISKTPNKFSASTTKSIARPRLTNGLFASC